MLTALWYRLLETELEGEMARGGRKASDVDIIICVWSSNEELDDDGEGGNGSEKVGNPSSSRNGTGVAGGVDADEDRGDDERGDGKGIETEANDDESWTTIAGRKSRIDKVTPRIVNFLV
jgi:hypothetical protein